MKTNEIKRAINNDSVKLSLIKYFVNKVGKDGLDTAHSPETWQDMLIVMPFLDNLVEIKPFSESIDMQKDEITIGWNLFVLGLHRLYLGRTRHNGLKSTVSQFKSGNMSSNGNYESDTTPRKIIVFITRILGESKNGYVDTKSSVGTNNLLRQFVGSMVQDGFNQPNA